MAPGQYAFEPRFVESFREARNEAGLVEIEITRLEADTVNRQLDRSVEKIPSGPPDTRIRFAVPNLSEETVIGICVDPYPHGVLPDAGNVGQLSAANAFVCCGDNLDRLGAQVGRRPVRNVFSLSQINQGVRRYVTLV